jgi:hypothetical protein
MVVPRSLHWGMNEMLEDAFWKPYRMFCTRCRNWRNDVYHTGCPDGQEGSLVLIDIAGMRKGCSKCQQSWAIENVVFTCSCGHPQPVEYTAEIPPLKHGDKVLMTDGDLSWVRTRSHQIVVGKLSR